VKGEEKEERGKSEEERVRGEEKEERGEWNVRGLFKLIRFLSAGICGFCLRKSAGNENRGESR